MDCDESRVIRMLESIDGNANVPPELLGNVSIDELLLVYYNLVHGQVPSVQGVWCSTKFAGWIHAHLMAENLEETIANDSQEEESAVLLMLELECFYSRAHLLLAHILKRLQVIVITSGFFPHDSLKCVCFEILSCSHDVLVRLIGANCFPHKYHMSVLTKLFQRIHADMLKMLRLPYPELSVTFNAQDWFGSFILDLKEGNYHATLDNIFVNTPIEKPPMQIVGQNRPREDNIVDNITYKLDASATYAGCMRAVNRQCHSKPVSFVSQFQRNASFKIVTNYLKANNSALPSAKDCPQDWRQRYTLHVIDVDELRSEHYGDLLETPAPKEENFTALDAADLVWARSLHAILSKNVTFTDISFRDCLQNIADDS